MKKETESTNVVVPDGANRDLGAHDRLIVTGDKSKAPEVFDQRSVGDDDDVFFSEPFGVVKHFSIIFEHQPLIGVCSGKGSVESSTVFTYRNTEGAEPLLTCAVEDLKR